MNILFWNTNIPKRGNTKADNIDSCLLSLAIENQIDLLILAEYGESMGQLCRIISNQSGTQYIPIPNLGGCTKIKGIINGKYNIDTLHERDRYQIIKISTVFYDLIVAMIHSDSKRYSRNNRQEEILRQFHTAIVDEQEKHKCKNVLAIGDFNANPFEEACLSAGNLFALPFVDGVIGSPTRCIGYRVYQKFYNPTWKFFGNRTIPYTTYHYNDSGDMANCYWNIIDQVVIRPSLVKAFDDDKLRIISCTKKHQLLDNGKPDKKNYSDHLPLFCALKEDLI
ncbi:MAG: hypothetical protein FWC89_05115 [Defluviitaleaceae bacterium]|nr:hypothetical protein [Defluviitaleaceae bacterium]